MCFFDLSGNEQLRIDEFLFGVEFFIQGNRLKECLMLFQELDVNNDGLLDLSELDGIFYLSADKDLTSDLQTGEQFAVEKLNEDTMDNYIHGGYGTYNKRPLPVAEMLQLP